MSFDHRANICSSYASILPTDVFRYSISYGDSSLIALLRELEGDNVLMLGL